MIMCSFGKRLLMTAKNLPRLQMILWKKREIYTRTFSSGQILSYPELTKVYGTVCLKNHLLERSNQKWHRQPVRTFHHFSKFSSFHGKLHKPHQALLMAVQGVKSDHTAKSFVNPLLDLQKYVSVPIFTEEQAVFGPSRSEIDEAMLIFQGPQGSNVKNPAKFVGSFVDGSQVPDLNLPEVCFLGRSNVGKSSLINILLSAHPEVNVRVSKKPGHTKTVNLFRMGRRFTLVDMPGYGHNMPRNFQESVETYLSNRRRLCRTFLLVDAEVGLTSTDTIALDMLQEFGVPYVVVLTKIDKAGRHRLLRNLLAVMKTCQEKGGHGCFSQPFLVSSKTGDGVIFLQTFIAYVTGCIAVKGL